MGIRDFFGKGKCKGIIVSRLKTVAGDKKNFVTTATVDMAIQEMDKASRTALQLEQDRAWQAYADIEQDIEEGDLLRDNLGIEYRVGEVTIRDYGINQHLDIILYEYSKT